MDEHTDRQPEASPAAAAEERNPNEPLAVSIEILRIREGDTIVVRADAVDQAEVARIGQGITLLLNQRGLRDVQLLVVPSNLDIKSLNPEQMRRQGWRRANLIDTAFGNGGLNRGGGRR